MSKHIFNISDIPQEVVGSIITSIQTLHIKKCKRSLYTWLTASASTSILSLIAIIQIGTSMKDAGVGQYLSIMTSDADTAIAYWKDILLAITDSIPLMGTVVFLSLSAFALWSFIKYSQALTIQA